MQRTHRPGRALSCLVAGFAVSWAGAASAGKLQVIYQASQTDGPLIETAPNADGSVFVETPFGSGGHGQILLLTPAGKNEPYTVTVVKSFGACDQDGGGPSGSLVADAGGNIWGMTNASCAHQNGTVFELVKPQSQNGSWTFRTAVSMPNAVDVGARAGSGYGNMAFDKSGNLYGIAVKGGFGVGCDDDGCGKIFKIPASTLDGSQKKKIKVLYTFPSDGKWPSGLIRDKQGNLYGIQYTGGDQSLGAIWEVSPNGAGGSWTRTTPYEFCLVRHNNICDDGYGPAGLPAVNDNGELYGTTEYGGTGANGTTWKLTPNGAGGWTFLTLHAFTEDNGCNSPDLGVRNPIENVLLSKSGQPLSFMTTGGADDACQADQTFYQGGLISTDPASGSYSVVSNAFGALNLASGPWQIGSSPSQMGKTVYGTSLQYYDALTNSFSQPVVFKIVQ